MKNWAHAFVMAAYPVLLVASTLDALPQQGGVPATKEGEQIEQFLRTAGIVGIEDFPRGNTGLQKVTLAQGETVSHAAFRCAGFPLELKDSWKLEIAAYELDKLLGLNMVPPAVERTVRGTTGSLQLWIENTMSEADRLEKNIGSPDAEAWSRQIWKVRVFDQLVYNIDRTSVTCLSTRTGKFT